KRRRDALLLLLNDQGGTAMHSGRTRFTLSLVIVGVFAMVGAGMLAQGAVGGGQGGGGGLGRAEDPNAVKSTMADPYPMSENWPHLGNIKPGAAIGIIPDGKGGVWLQQRSEPAILHINAAGDVVKRFEVTFASAHGFCMDRDGNLWAADSSPFGDTGGVTGV